MTARKTSTPIGLEEVEQEPKQEPTLQPTGPMIYVGPNVTGGRLMQYTVFRGGVPDYLADLLDKQPAIRQLIVPVHDLAAVQTRIGTPGMLEHALFQQIKKDGDR